MHTQMLSFEDSAIRNAGVSGDVGEKEAHEMNGQDRSWHGLGIDWADEAPPGLGIQRRNRGQTKLRGGQAQRRIIAGMVDRTAKPIWGEASRGCIGTGAWEG